MHQPIKTDDAVAQDFAQFGIERLAYVKRVVSKGVCAYAIYAADGTEIVTVEARAAALKILREHDLEPASIH
jgi:hypothetical protein